MTQPAQHTNTAALPELSGEVAARAPVFILGMMPRSGTNFLHRLICQHPDCGAINTTPVREDYLVHHSKWLGRYMSRLQWQWGNWGADAAFVSPLFTSVGEGLARFLASLSDAQRIVTKTPSVANLDVFFTYFAQAHLLLIVRDGRSIVASGMSGFGWNFETATRKWQQTARTILAFQQKQAMHADRFKLVHYETLNTNTAEELGSILEFLNLDTAMYNFEAALDTPVYGSSFMKAQGDTVSWKPQEKKKDFDTNQRWKTWSAFKHARFNWLAGKELEALGYAPEGRVKPGFFGVLLHKTLDVAYILRRLPGRSLRAAREGMRAFVDSMNGKGRGKVNLKK